jgi:perosamine synthetase
MRIRRTIPPTAAPVKPIDLVHGLIGLFRRGKRLEKLEENIKEYFKVRHVFCVSSGKAALMLILSALRDVSGRRQVIIPAYTCFSVPSAIVKAGLEIVLCDIDSGTFDFNYTDLENAITNDTLCVVATHLFGIPADLERIEKLCRERKVFVVEDAAQAMGGQYKGRLLGTISDVSFYSLGRGKNITCGSGGIIVTNDDSIAAALMRQYVALEEPLFKEDVKNWLQTVLMSLFIQPPFYWFPAGMPLLKLGQTFFYKDFPIKKLSSGKAALLQNWQERLTESNRIRTQTATFFCERIPQNTRRADIPYLRFPLLMDDRQMRDSIYTRSQQYGLGLSLMYPTPVNEIEELKTSFYGQVFPVAKRVAETVVTLPTHYLLSETDKQTICGLFTDSLASDSLTAIKSAFEAS